MEQRTVPAIMRPIGLVFGTGHKVYTPKAGGTSPSGYAPAQILHAYGFDQLSLNGTGETIAIVDAYHDPNALSDLQTFDKQFNLPDPPTFSQVDENGKTATSSLPTDPSGGWEVEESLDIEWAHAIAPKANILLVEASSASSSDLMAAVDTARNAKGVVAVSMSWGTQEFSTESSFDSHFTTPTGHGAITFFASSGDNGTPAGWPATSPDVVAVGGTSLNLDANNNRSSETGWSGSGGGYSSYYSEPSYQSNYAASSYVQGTLNNTILKGSPRGNPDVSLVADPNTGVAVYDSYPYQGNTLDWVDVGGTSASSPMWAGLLALVDQGRGSLGSLDGASQTLPALYKLGANSTSYGNDFYDVTSGNNGLSAVAGYDLVTGLGSPKANNLIPDLEKAGVNTLLSVTTSTSAPTAGTPFSITVTAQNASGQTLTGYTGTVHFTTTDTGTGIALPGDYTFTSADQGTHTFTNLVTLVTAGKETVTATDKANSTISGQATVTVGAAAASSLTLTAPSSASQNGPFSVTVTAKDKYGNTATGYAGTVAFKTSDTGAGVVIPGPHTFGQADQGTYTFTNGVTLVTQGNQTLTASDTGNSSLTSTATVNVQPPLPATHFAVTVPANAVTAGTPFSITVTALDANNNTASGYVGTVHFTTSDTGNGIALPGDYTFAAGDHGSHTFTNLFTLVTAGSQTVTATDTGSSTITGNGTVTVGAAAAAKLSVTGFPSPITAGTPGSFTVTATDKYGNTATGYTGTVAFGSSDSRAQLPGNSTLTNGTGSFSATFETVGNNQSLTATDTANASLTGTQSGISVTASTANAPAVMGMAPSSGSTAGGYVVTIYGSNLAGATAVYFGGTPGTVMGSTTTAVGVMAPAHAAGVVDVTVVTPAGTSGITIGDKFTYVGGTQPGGPTVSGINPTSGPTAGGTMVMISGSNLAGATAVYFGTVAGTILGDNGSMMGVMSPAEGAGAVDVTVVTPAGTSPTTPADQFTYTGSSQPSGPTVSAISPTTGPTTGGTVVTVSGTNLAGARGVYFGGVAGVIQSDTSTTIKVTAPAEGAGTVDVTVVTAAGTSPTSRADQFTYVASQPTGPTVSRISPTSGPTAGGTMVMISGSNLAGATAVYFGTVAGTILGDNGSMMGVMSPAEGAGAVDVTVVTPAGTSPTTPADQFTYVASTQPSGPTVSGVSPNSGPTTGGTPVTISGSNLTGATAVYFGTVAATITSDTATAITVMAPAAQVAGTVDVTVMTPAGSSPTTSADQYTYTASSSGNGPVVLYVHPNSGPTAGGTVVIVSGKWLGDPTAVYFGTTPAQILLASLTGDEVIAPPHAAGTVDVTVVTPEGTSAVTSLDQYTYTGPPPAVQLVGPNAGSAAGGFEVAITGSNLAGARAVYFGTTPAAILAVSNTSVAVMVPAHAAGMVNVTVVTPSGASAVTSADHYTYTTNPGRAPTVQLVAASAGSTTGGSPVVIFGTNLAAATAVYFGSTPATILAATATALAVKAPAHAAGAVDVTVVTPAGRSAVTSADRFTYQIGPSAHLAALDALLATWSRSTATLQQSNYLIAEILTGGGVANFNSYFSAKCPKR